MASGLRDKIFAPHIEKLISSSTNLPSHLPSCAKLFVLCAITHVFDLLCHFYNSQCKGRNATPMVMASPVKNRAVIDIRATVNAHSDIADDRLAIHGLSDAASLHGIGKARVSNCT